jgi:riboflavin kinase/FMN adenylyltransferase
VEVHLLDYRGDLYGEELEATVVARVRDEQRFPSLEALRAQIARDIERARQLL